MATFIELDARDESQGCNVTVAEIEFPDTTPPLLLDLMERGVVGMTIGAVRSYPGFSWWEDPVMEDTIIASAFVNRV